MRAAAHWGDGVLAAPSLPPRREGTADGLLASALQEDGGTPSLQWLSDMKPLDPRLHAVRPDLADLALQGKVEAQRFVAYVDEHT